MFKKACGFQALQNDAAPVEMDSIFSVMSCTKLITTIAALQCVESGLIFLDDSVEIILPELSGRNIITLKGDMQQNSSSFELTPARNKITLRHLLTHTSGIGYSLWHPTLLAWHKSRGVDCNNRLAIVDDLEEPLLFEPGEGWAYGASHDWVGTLISRLNDNVTLEDYCSSHIFMPLNLHSITFDLQKKHHAPGKKVSTAHRTSSGWSEFTIPTPAWPFGHSGGAGLHSSVADYIRVLGDLLREPSSLLSKASIDEMFKPQLSRPGPQIDDLYRSERFFSNLAGGSVQGLRLNFGLGSLIFEDDVKCTGMPAGTMGFVGLPNILWAVNRERGLATMYASQVMPPGDRRSTKLASAFQAAIWQLDLEMNNEP